MASTSDGGDSGSGALKISMAAWVVSHASVRGCGADAAAVGSTVSVAAIPCAASSAGEGLTADEATPLVTNPINSLANPKTVSALQPMSTAICRHEIRCS